MKKFILGRFKAICYSITGALHLIKTENAIQAQLFFSLCFVVAGFYFEISKIEWMFQILAIGMILFSEALNTAIEKISDFIHPDYNKKIGLIKDISAGSVFFSVVFGLVVALLIYYPKISLFILF